MQFEPKKKKPNGSTYRPNVAKANNAAKRRKQNLLIIAIVGAAVLIVALVIIITVFARAATNPPASSAQVQSGASAAGSAASYVRPASIIDEEAMQGTVLGETEDAGMEYVQETLFLGDSNTNRMMYYSDITGVTLENCIAVDSMGITAFETMACAQFKGQSSVLTMPKALPIIQPKRVVITFGTNNTGMALDSFIDDYTDAINAIKDNWEYCDIIIGGIFPVDQYRQNTQITMQKIDEMNKALAELAQKEGVKFLNWGEAIRDEATGYSRFDATIQDGVHLTRDGMQSIFTYMRTHSYVAEDRRPKPLKAIPERIGVRPGVVSQDPGKVQGPVDWSSSSSSEGETVEVVFSAWDEGKNAAGGGSFTTSAGSAKTLTFEALPGDKLAQVTAVPAEGYEFAYWSCTVGSISNVNSATLPPFLVYPNVQPGETVKVVATFRLKQQSSSSSSSQSMAPSPQSSSSSSSSSPSEVQPPSVSVTTPSDSTTSSSVSVPSEQLPIDPQPEPPVAQQPENQPPQSSAE